MALGSLLCVGDVYDCSGVWRDHIHIHSLSGLVVRYQRGGEGFIHSLYSKDLIEYLASGNKKLVFERAS